MFCELRRKKQQLSEQECTQILDKELSGVLATFGDEGYPYTVHPAIHSAFPHNHTYY